MAQTVFPAAGSVERYSDRLKKMQDQQHRARALPRSISTTGSTRASEARRPAPLAT